MKNPPTPLQASDRLHVLPGGSSLQDRAVELADPEELAYAIKAFETFEVIIFDCPPGSDHLERLGLAAANIALICTNAHPLGILGAERVLGEIRRRQDRNQVGPAHCALVLTQLNKSRAFDKNLPGQLAAKHPHLPQLSIRQNSDLSWATAQRIPLLDSKHSNKAIEDIESIAKWIAQETVTKDG